MTFQDQDRFIWILSEKGLLKYDGVNFKAFTVANGLPINDIWYIKEDRSGRKWLGGYFNGLFYIKNDKVVEIKSGSNINSLLFTGENADTLFFTSMDEGTSFFMLKELNELVEVELVDNEIIKLHLDDVIIINEINSSQKQTCKVILTKNLRNFTFSGLITWKDAVIKMNQQFLELTNNKIRYWIVEQDGELKAIDPDSIFGEPIITINTLHPSGQLIIQFESKTEVYKNIAKLEHDLILERELSSLNDQNIAWAILDDEENVWCTLERNTIVMLPRGVEHIDQYHFAKDQRKKYINPIVRDNKLMFHELVGTLYEYDFSSRRLTSMLNEVDFSNGGINDLRATPEGYYYLFFKALYFQPDQGEIQKYPLSYDNLNFIPRALIPLGNDEFISDNFSFYYIENGVLKQKDSNNERLRSNCLTESAGDWIVSTPEEVIFLDKKTRRQYNVSIPGVECIQVFGKNALIGTNGHGLMLIDRSGKVYAKLHEDKSINSILIYKENIIISATNNGIYIDIIVAGNKLQTYRFIGVEQGLSSTSINDVLFSDGKLLAMSNDGVDVIDFAEIMIFEAHKPTIIIDSLIVNGQLYGKDHTFFEWDKNSFVFHFSGISFSSLGNVRYKYRILGVEDDWIFTDESSIRFPNLPFGDYALELVAISSESIESAPLIYSFSIGRHFTQTWWFSAILFLIIGAAIGILGYQIQRRKTRKVEIEKQIATLEMNALQSQMNPHFVFNSLNSIQSVLFLKGERETNRYIGAFSKLIRQTLDNSKKGEITIQEELDYLLTYLDLETRRLDGGLTHLIELDDDLELDGIVIPCMIVQPIVENAILHGLTPKKSNRKLTIRFSKNQNYLQIEVEDNGIGREKAEMNAKHKPHNSWATTILQERLKVLGKINVGKVSYDIIDLSDGEDATGTLVKIQLPINYVD